MSADVQLQTLRNEYKKLTAKLILNEPFLGLLAQRMRVIAVNEPENPSPARTDNTSIIINIPAFSKYSTDEKIYIIAHEIGHIIDLHLQRAQNVIKRHPELDSNEGWTLINIAADAKVNQMLDEASSLAKPQNRTTIDVLERFFGISNAEKKSMEEILEELANKTRNAYDKTHNKRPQWNDLQKSSSNSSQSGQSQQRPLPQQNSSQSQQTPNSQTGQSQQQSSQTNQSQPAQSSQQNQSQSQQQSQVINEGDPLLKTNDVEKQAEAIKRIITESAVSAKLIGKLPGYAERLVSELLKPKISWKRLLRVSIEKGLGREVKRNWMRPSRKGDDWPGKDLLTINKVVVLVDTSGSISEHELQRFLSEVYAVAAETATVIIIPWDATAYDPIIVQKKEEVKKIKVKGRGGTEILPALKLLDKKYRDANLIIIFSDWEIGDINNSEVIALLKKYRSRIIAVTTSAKPPEFLKSVEVRE